MDQGSPIRPSLGGAVATTGALLTPDPAKHPRQSPLCPRSVPTPSHHPVTDHSRRTGSHVAPRLPHPPYPPSPTRPQQAGTRTQTSRRRRGGLPEGESRVQRSSVLSTPRCLNRHHHVLRSPAPHSRGTVTSSGIRWLAEGQAEEAHLTGRTPVVSRDGEQSVARTVVPLRDGCNHRRDTTVPPRHVP